MVVSVNKSLQCSVLGDGFVGKSCLVERFLGGEFNQEYVATLQDSYTTTCNVNGDSLEMNITDMAGEHEELGSLDMPDVFIVCFSLVDRDSLESVLNFWVPKIQSQGKDTPIVLVGTQLDKRRSQRKGHVATEEGLSIAQTLCASAYVECSAKENIGVDVALYSILLASNMCRRKSGLFKRVLGR